MSSGTEFGVDCADHDRQQVDPMVLFASWVTPVGAAAPPLMALATVGGDGYPRVRHVLLSHCDTDAMYFHTDTRSSKAAELQVHPCAALTLAWPQVGRQVTVHGDVRVSSDAEQRRSYATRSRYLQLLAWLNDPTVAALDEPERHTRWAEFDRDHADLEPPTTWIGYALTPLQITFWRADPAGPSQRIRFTRDRVSWSSEVLPG